MEQSEVLVLTEYISIWLWQVLGFIFLCSALTVYALSLPTNKVIVITIILFSLFIYSEYQSLSKQRKFRNGNK